MASVAPPSTASLAGGLLLAMPGIGDPRFVHAVIALVTHDGDGALGVGVGSLLAGISFHGLCRQLDIDPGAAPDRPIHAGGPVEQQRGFVLHSLDWRAEETLATTGGWGLTGTVDVLRAIAEDRGPARWLAALGYAGWSPGQLDEEMTRHGWFVAAGTSALLFDTLPERRWTAAFAAAGIDTRMLASASGRA